MKDDLIRMHRAEAELDFRRAALWVWIRRQLSPGPTIDVGGGAGYIAGRLIEVGFPTVLAEPDPDLARFSMEVLSAHPQLKVVQKAAEELDPTELGQFTNLLLLDVLEHIEDDAHALRTVARLIEPSGRVIISVPAVPALFGRRDVLYGHYRRYSARSLGSLIRAAALELQCMRYWNALGVAPYLLYEKILRRPINDKLRHDTGRAIHAALRWGLHKWLTIETRLRLPVGLSLLAVARRSEQR